MSEITITATPPKPISVTLVGEEYTVRPIKGALGIALGQRFQSKTKDLAKMQKNLDQLIAMMFGKKEVPAIRKRLEDPDDLLDMEHLFDLMNALTEMSTGNPTTSPSDSSQE